MKEYLKEKHEVCKKLRETIKYLQAYQLACNNAIDSETDAFEIECIKMNLDRAEKAEQSLKRLIYKYRF